MATRAMVFEFLLAGLRDPDNLVPLNAGTVEFYEVGTSTPKNVWTEEDKTNAFTEYTLDTNGVAELYGDGNYKVIIKDSSGATEYTFSEIKMSSADYNVRTVTSATVAATADDDLILANSSSNSITVNVAAVAGFRRPLTIKKISASNTVTVDPTGAEAIDGDATVAITQNNDALTIDPDTNASTWRRRGQFATSLIGLTATVAELNQLEDNTFDNPVTINDPDSSGDAYPLQIEVASLPTGQSAFIFLGQDVDGVNEAAAIGYTYDSGTVADSILRLGFYGGAAILQMDGNQTVGINTAPAGSGGAALRVDGGNVEVYHDLTVGADQGGSRVITVDSSDGGDASLVLNNNGVAKWRFINTNATDDLLIQENDSGYGTWLQFDKDADAIITTKDLDVGAGTTTRVAPAGTFVNGGSGISAISTVLMAIDTDVTENTWESVGPTGSGATNIWTALDSVPTDADWIEVKIDGTCATTSGGSGNTDNCRVYAQDSGGGDTTSAVNQIFRCAGAIISGAAYGDAHGTAKIPVTSGVFELYWNSEFETSDNLDMALVGWGFNP